MDRGPGSPPSRARPRRLRIALAWASVGAWAGLVWWLGSGDFGAPATSRYLEPLIRWLLPDLPRADVLTLVAAVRKLAHPTVYGVLAGLAFHATWVSGVARPLRAAAIAFALAVGVAALDEIRQASLPSRTGNALDVALDASGALAAVGARASSSPGALAPPSPKELEEMDANSRGRLLDSVERLGNALPDPTTLFALGALLVALGAQVAVATQWTVSRSESREVTAPVLDAAGDPILGADGEPLVRAVRDAEGRPRVERAERAVHAKSLLSTDGIYWMLSSLVGNFTAFPPLGVVLVGMLGIGMAERTGFIGALLRAVLVAVPPGLLTPAVFFVGVMSSMGLDAGYVVLPPVAAALFQAVGRSPLVGLAAVFAGVSAGFSANLFITSLDPLLAEFSTASARLLDPGYEVAASSNWWFMIASTFLLTGVGWAVTSVWVEPRFAAKPPEEGGADPEVTSAEPTALAPEEKRALGRAVLVAAAAFAAMAALTWIPGMPLHGMDGAFPRWVRVIVPLLFLGFLLPGLVYGFSVGRLQNDRDVAAIFGETMAAMGPYIVLAFFAAQFIAWFAYSNLGEMLAITGGRALAGAGLPPALLMVGFIGVVGVGNLFIGSMSAKYAFFAPVFVPMFMQAGISPELTQVAYRVGDSVTNVITPLNPYVVIILTFMQRYVPRAGIGTLVALMLPYTIAFGVVWSAGLALWVWLGAPLGPSGPLTYPG